MNTTTDTARIPDNEKGVQAIVELANKAAIVEDFEIPTEGMGHGLPASIPVLFDHRPSNGMVDIKTYVEKFRQFPARRTGTAQVTTIASFIDLANRHKDAHSAIFAETAWPTPKLMAVLNYHEVGDGSPRHLDHRVNYAFPVTEELKAWIGNNNKPMEQADFARFLEDHTAELAAPFEGEKSHFENLFKERMATPMELVSLSRNLEIHVGAKFKRAERLSSGERTVEFVEEHLTGKGEKVDIPGCFVIALPAFVDGEAVRIAARLRYRAAGGSITWFYSLYRWDVELRNRVKDDLQKAATETAIPCFEGLPEV